MPFLKVLSVNQLKETEIVRNWHPPTTSVIYFRQKVIFLKYFDPDPKNQPY
jgi:hypothetical protein